MKMAIAEVVIGDKTLWFVFNPDEDLIDRNTKFHVVETVLEAVEFCENNNFEFFVLDKEERKSILENL